MLNKLTQKKSVLGERAVDAARQHAHIDTNRTYNMTTRDRTYSSRADPYAHSEQAAGYAAGPHIRQACVLPPRPP